MHYIVTFKNDNSNLFLAFPIQDAKKKSYSPKRYTEPKL